MPRRVERTRNMGKWTEAKYWGTIRSCLRLCFRYWGPITEARKRARVGRNKYLCAKCGKIYSSKEIQVDHVVPVGSLKRYEDLPGFVKRLTEEDPSKYQVLCKTCHQKKTNSQKGK